ncbi:MAG: hypothetical protein ACI9OJ_000199 [Myxococcota bacterium]|jgi:hypothetical protein
MSLNDTTELGPVTVSLFANRGDRVVEGARGEHAIVSAANEGQEPGSEQKGTHLNS